MKNYSKEVDSLNKPAILGGTKAKTKPFVQWPQWDESEEEALINALRSGKWSRRNSTNLNEKGASSYIELLEEDIKKRFDVEYALAVASGTAALDVAVRAAGIQPGDEVIVPAYSYIASATCVLHAGAKPVFVDILEDTWNLNVNLITESITSKTKAIIVVHIAGQPSNMTELMKIAKAKGLIVIEDAAQAIGAMWGNSYVGTIGDIGCFSLESTKNVTAGEGGIVTTNNVELYKKLYSLHMAGRPFGGEWYQHESLGWNYRLSEFQAAIAYVQLQRMESLNKIREENAIFLREQLKDFVGIKITGIEESVTRQAYHLFTFRFLPEEWGSFTRKRFILAMNAEGIPCYEGYKNPIYGTELFANQGYLSYKQLCPIAEKICSSSVWIPQNVLLGDKTDQKEVVYAFEKICKSFR